MSQNKFTFNANKPIPIPWEYRYPYKLIQLILFLKINSVGSKSSLIKLHFLSWIVRSGVNKELFLENLNSLSDFYTKSWWIDPALNRAITIWIADNFILFNLKTQKYKLSKKWESLYNIIISNHICQEEIIFLQRVWKRLTEEKISLISKNS